MAAARRPVIGAVAVGVTIVVMAAVVVFPDLSVWADGDNQGCPARSEPVDATLAPEVDVNDDGVICRRSIGRSDKLSDNRLDDEGDGGDDDPHELRMALTADLGSCDPEAAQFDALPWEDSTIGAIVTETGVEVGDPTWMGAPHAVCLHNNGSSSGEVGMRFAKVKSREVGGCTEHEGAEGNDTTCRNRQPGELEHALQSVAVTAVADEACADVTRSFTELVANGAVLASELPPGAACGLTITIGLAGSTAPQRFAAETDSLTWDIIFTLSGS